jgi:N-acetylmuramoyl-L-alanine amidase
MQDDVCPCPSCQRPEISEEIFRYFGQISRKMDKISIHCSDSDSKEHDNIETIRRWHIDGNKWSDIGYHFVITKDGLVHNGRPLNKIPAAVHGFNKNMVAICLTGKHVFSFKQYLNCKSLIKCLCYDLKIPVGNVHPHNYWNKDKTCPNFDIKLVL